MYREQLAEVYDQLYLGAGKDYAAESAELAALIRARSPGATSLLDVACGTGEHLRYLREEFTVEGVELSGPMRRLAEVKLPGIRVHAGDMRDFRLGRTFDAVLCLFSAIGYNRSVADLRVAVAAMVTHLAPGGLLVVEPWIYPEDWRDNTLRHTVTEHDGRTVIRLGHSTRDGLLSRMEMHYLVGDEGGIRHFTDTHELTLFTAEEYAESMRAAGCDRVEFVPGWRAGRDRIVATRAR